MAASIPAMSEELLKIPEEFICDITLEVMRDPVIAADGHSYERTAMEEWLRGHRTSPKTNIPLSHTTLMPNIALRQAIERFMKEMPEIQRVNIQRQQELMNLQEIIRIREREAEDKPTKDKDEKKGEQLIHKSFPSTVTSAASAAAASVLASSSSSLLFNSSSSSAAEAGSPYPIAQSAIVGVNLEVDAFLKLVADGKQDEAEACLINNPNLVLASGDVIDYSGRPFRRITGFQYALWALDWHMWKMILKYLKQFPGEAEAQAQTVATGSWVSDHGEYFNMQPLLAVLETYRANYMDWSIDKSRDHWIREVGGAQHLLPMHVFQEYCYPNRGFIPTPTFTEDEFPRIRISELDFDLSKVGIDFGICFVRVMDSNLVRQIRQGLTTCVRVHFGVACSCSLLSKMHTMLGQYMPARASSLCDLRQNQEFLSTLLSVRLQQRRELLTQLGLGNIAVTCNSNSSAACSSVLSATRL